MTAFNFSQIVSIVLISGFWAFGNLEPNTIRAMALGYLCAVVPHTFGFWLERHSR